MTCLKCDIDLQEVYLTMQYQIFNYIRFFVKYKYNYDKYFLFLCA